MFAEPGQGGKHRLRVGPPGGVVAAAGVVLLATAASPVPAPSGPPEAPRPAGGTASPAQDDYQSWAADGDQLPEEAPPAPQPGRAEVSTVDELRPVIPTVFTGDIPTTVLDAYRRARDLTNVAQPGCHLPLELLAAIGKVETGHARRGQVDPHGTTLYPILGPVLDGNVFAAIPDTDRGVLDGDVTWDRAVGPMQFIPSTWQRWAADGNGDHRADPHNVYDASLAAARYLCAANRDLGTPQGLDEAIFSYNHSTSYRNLVLSWMATYRAGTIPTPDAPGQPVLMIAAPASTSTTPPPSSTTTAPPPSSTPPDTTTPPPTTTTPPPTSTTPTPPDTTTPPPTTTTPPSSEPPPPTTTEPTAEPSTAPAAPSDTTQSGPIQGVVCTVGGLLTPLTGTSVLCPPDGQAG